MRYGIFSDVHSNLEALEAVIAAFKSEEIGQYLCVGDLVGYAANPRECIEKVKALAMVSVAGNHDWGCVNLFSLDYFNSKAREAIFWTKQNLDEEETYFLESLKLVFQNPDLTLVHGTLDNPQDFNYMVDGYLAWETFRILKTKICFIGHTHSTGVFIKDEGDQVTYREDNSFILEDDQKYIVNVGSVGQPRDGNPNASYCVYDTEKKKVELKRISYDIEAARKKIIASGLPQSLGDRLRIGY